MAGPGTELKKIIPSLFKKEGCGCNDFAKAMDVWGPEVCEHRKHIIIDHLVQQAKKHRLTKHLPEAITKRQAESWLRKAIERSRG